MRYIFIAMLLLGLAACQNEEKTAVPVAQVEQHESVSTQAVKKDDMKPAVVQENMEESSQAVVDTMVNNPCAAKAAAMAANTDTAKKAVAVNPCATKAMVANTDMATGTDATKAKAMTTNTTAAKKVATVSSFNVKKCKACHAVGKKKVGPAWKDVVAAYGDVATLADVFKSGFNVGDRKVIAANAKWKSKAGMMTGQYKKLIQGHGDAAAQALFDAVARGKI